MIKNVFISYPQSILSGWASNKGMAAGSKLAADTAAGLADN
jgi:hypothetical protein